MRTGVDRQAKVNRVILVTVAAFELWCPASGSKATFQVVSRVVDDEMNMAESLRILLAEFTVSAVIL